MNHRRVASFKVPNKILHLNDSCRNDGHLSVESSCQKKKEVLKAIRCSRGSHFPTYNSRSGGFKLANTTTFMISRVSSWGSSISIVYALWSYLLKVFGSDAVTCPKELGYQRWPSFHFFRPCGPFGVTIEKISLMGRAKCSEKECLAEIRLTTTPQTFLKECISKALGMEWIMYL